MAINHKALVTDWQSAAGFALFCRHSFIAPFIPHKHKNLIKSFLYILFFAYFKGSILKI
jgi:hypothetical protein